MKVDLFFGESRYRRVAVDPQPQRIYLEFNFYSESCKVGKFTKLRSLDFFKILQSKLLSMLRERGKKKLPRII